MVRMLHTKGKRCFQVDLKYNWKTSSSLPEAGRKPFRENTAAKIQKFRYTNKNVKKISKIFCMFLFIA